MKLQLPSNQVLNDMYLKDLKYEKNSEKAVQCLNDMVTNALAHIEDSLKYLSELRDPAIFKFCAIPQVCLWGFPLKISDTIYIDE